MGAAVASIAPDLDWIGVILGMPTHRVHRRGTHSLLVLVILSTGAMLTSSRNRKSDDLSRSIAWSVALLSHPVLDLLTTSPGAVAHGYGIPLFWPVSHRRWAVRQTIFNAPGLIALRSPSKVWKSLLPEVCILGPVAIALILAGKRFRPRGPR
jgi:membrane-bound metal-dependent hydrolase YbcI (DUF457 family)